MADRPPLDTEIATIDRDWWAGLYVGELLRPRDTVLVSIGGGLDAYRRTMHDPQVRSCWQQRTRGLISREWMVEPGGDKRLDAKAADFVRALLDRLAFDELSEKMLLGVAYGYAVAELMYARDGLQVTIDRVKVRRPERFAWDRQFRLRLLTPEKLDGEVLPDKKFWSYSSGAEDDDNPYGVGLCHWLYWPAFFKQHYVKFWAVWAEKFATGTPWAEMSESPREGEQDRILATLRRITQGAAIVVPHGTQVRMLEVARAAGGDYQQAAGYMDGEIAKIILSQTMTTDQGSSEAQARVHQDVALAVIQGDADLICGSFNRGPIAWLTEWNFPGAAPPRVWRVCEPPEDQGARADRDTKICALGFRPTPEYIEDAYGPGWQPAQPEPAPAGAAPPPPEPPPEPAPAFGAPEGQGGGAGVAPSLPYPPIAPAHGAPFNTHLTAAFSAAGSSDDPVPALVDLLAAAADPVVADMIGEVRGLLDAPGATLESVRDGLAALWPELPTPRLAELIAQGMLAAQLAGRAAIAALPGANGGPARAAGATFRDR